MASVAQDPIYQTIFKIQYFVLQPHFTGPLFVRIAFHDAATWNRNSTTNKGGCAPSCYTPLYRLLAFLTSNSSSSLCHKRTFLLVPSAYMCVCAVLSKFFQMMLCGSANGSVRYEFDWPSNGGLQRFAYPLVWVRAGSPIMTQNIKEAWVNAARQYHLVRCMPPPCHTRVCRERRDRFLSHTGHKTVARLWAV